MTSPRSHQRPSAEVARDIARSQAADLRAIMTAQVAELLAWALTRASDDQEDHGALEDYPRITAIETMTQHGTPALTGDRPAGVRLRLSGGVEAVLMVDLRDIDPHRWEPIEPSRLRAAGCGSSAASPGIIRTYQPDAGRKGHKAVPMTSPGSDRQPRKRSEARQRTELVAFRLLPGERDQLAEAARHRNISLSELLRSSALDAISSQAGSS